MTGTLKVAASALGLVVGLVVLSGALPGEMRGCSTDISDEVDHVGYCRDRCEVLCERVVECGLYIGSGELPDGGTILDLCQTDCEAEYGCRNPFMCPNEDRYISELEAETCLEEWGGLSCAVFERAAGCGTGFEFCPRPDVCTQEELCDGPEWE